jgi:hypothetical protein
MSVVLKVAIKRLNSKPRPKQRYFNKTDIHIRHVNEFRCKLAATKLNRTLIKTEKSVQSKVSTGICGRSCNHFRGGGGRNKFDKSIWNKLECVPKMKKTMFVIPII